jgi:hypothetical protein
MGIKRQPKKLKLGKHYTVWFGYKNKMTCRFIQPTKYGFNFLNLDTNKCILKQHLYPSKCENHSPGDWFWINERMNIDECK